MAWFQVLIVLGSCAHLFPGVFVVLDATSDDGRVVLAFLVLLGFNVGFAIIAAALIAYRVSIVHHPCIVATSNCPPEMRPPLY